MCKTVQCARKVVIQLSALEFVEVLLIPQQIPFIVVVCRSIAIGKHLSARVSSGHVMCRQNAHADQSQALNPVL